MRAPSNNPADADTIHIRLPPERCRPNRGETLAVVLVSVGATLTATSIILGALLAVAATTR